MAITFHASLLSYDTKFGTVPLYIGEVPGLSGPNWSNDNARRMLQLLGLPFENDSLAGQQSIHEVLRAITYTKSRFEDLAPAYTRESSDTSGSGARVIGFGLDIEGIEERLDTFTQFVTRALQGGAKTIYWC